MSDGHVTASSDGTTFTLTYDMIMLGFQGLPLPDRMREAAKVLREVSAREGCAREYSWPPNLIEVRADRWEVEDRASAEREAMVEELARSLFATNRYSQKVVGFDGVGDDARNDYRTQARRLIDAGWTKTVSGDE